MNTDSHKKFTWIGMLARGLMPTLKVVIFIAVFGGVLALGPRLLNMDGDLGRHITVGNYILTQESITTRDVFSFTMPGQPLVPHEWLADVIFALVNRWMGLDGVVLLCAVLIASSLWMCMRLSLRRSGSLLWALFFAVLAMAASSMHWLARPHLFTLLLLILWADILDRIESGQGKIWWLLPLSMLFWVNTHGAFIAGFALVGLRIVGLFMDAVLQGQALNRNVLRQQGLAMGVSLLVTGLNPVGFRIWETSIGYLQNSYLVGHTAEYLSPDFHQTYAIPFLLLILLSIFLLSRPGRRVSGGDILVVCAWTGMGLISMRNIPLYALLAAPVLAESAALWTKAIPWLNRMEKLDTRLVRVEKRGSGWVWAVAIILAAGLLLHDGVKLDLTQQGNIFLPEVFPVQAVDHLETEPIEGNGFNYFPWGGYLLYRNYPERRVFIDGQTDFYGEALTRQYEQVITAADGWQTILDQYQVKWAMIPPTTDLAATMRETPGWENVYQDETAVIYVRR